MNIYTKKYSDIIEKFIAEEIEQQKYDDSKDERFFNDKTGKLKNDDKQYREWVIDNFIGNNVIDDNGKELETEENKIKELLCITNWKWSDKLN